MSRLLLILLAVLAVIVMARAASRGLDAARQSTEDAHLPDTVKTLAYVLLIVLMFGVVTGWLGGL